MAITVTSGRITLMQYNTTTNMIAFNVLPDQMSVSLWKMQCAMVTL